MRGSWLFLCFIFLDNRKGSLFFLHVSLWKRRRRSTFMKSLKVNWYMCHISVYFSNFERRTLLKKLKKKIAGICHQWFYSRSDSTILKTFFLSVPVVDNAKLFGQERWDGDKYALVVLFVLLSCKAGVLVTSINSVDTAVSFNCFEYELLFLSWGTEQHQ